MGATLTEAWCQLLEPNIGFLMEAPQLLLKYQLYLFWQTN
jgi:hypothetical protein